MKTIKIEFNEQSKAVTSTVKIEETSETINGEELLIEAQKLFDKANDYALLKTMNKNR
jgi:hypothetical protein